MKVYRAGDWAFKKDSRLVILTGAGISAESGLRTFRDSDGLWEEYRIEEVATPEAYENDPILVTRFYNERRKQLQSAKPNPAHFAISRLQEALGDRCFLITQNVDDLHEKAGSSQVHHMHGSLLKMRCLGDYCDSVDAELEHGVDDLCPGCGTYPLRPDVVWFGEIPHGLEVIYRHLDACSHFLYVGTSGTVYPAAGFKDLSKQNGALTLGLNLEVTPDAFTDFALEGKAGEKLLELVDLILKGCA